MRDQTICLRHTLRKKLVVRLLNLPKLRTILQP